MSGQRPDSAGIFAALSRLPDRDPAQRELDRQAAAGIRAGAAMQNVVRADPANQHAPWITHPRTRKARPRKPACCDHRGRYGHRGSAMRFVPCPTREAAS